MNIAVIGAGKMGLPLACVFADHGANVIACDAKKTVVEAINAGKSPIDEPGVPEIIQRVVAAGCLTATTNTPAAVARSEVVVVIVPVLLTAGKKADTGIIESVTRQIAQELRRGMMVSYETTLPIGGTRALLAILESRGLRGGRDFDLVFSPERVKSQRVIERLTQNPKIVGGLTPAAAARAAAFYRDYLGAPAINVGSLETAEMVKLAGMIYRDVNIALANELARYCEAAGVDFQTVVQAANNDGEANLLQAGIGVGGHCTPVYPHFLFQESGRLDVFVPLAELGRAINDAQPARALDRLEREWRPLRGLRALILGLGFRPQVKEDAFSPAYALAAEVARRGGDAQLHDPLYSPDEIRQHGFKPGSLTESPFPDLLVLHTAHAAYADLDFVALAARGLRAVLDGRNFWKPEQVRAAGLFYLAVGRPVLESVSGARAGEPEEPAEGGPITPHDASRDLKSYQMAEIVYDATVAFCKRFVDPRSPASDQMVRAARSAKENIAAGSAASGISRKMELQLVGAARAGFEELLQAYLDFLRQRRLPLWPKKHAKAQAVRELAYLPGRSYATYRSYIEAGSSEAAANAAICLVQQTNDLLDAQLKQNGIE